MGSAMDTLCGQNYEPFRSFRLKSNVVTGLLTYPPLSFQPTKSSIQPQTKTILKGASTYIPQVKHSPHDFRQSQAENDPAGVTTGATAGAPSTGAAASATVAAGAVSLAYAGTQGLQT